MTIITIGVSNLFLMSDPTSTYIIIVILTTIDNSINISAYYHIGCLTRIFHYRSTNINQKPIITINADIFHLYVLMENLLKLKIKPHRNPCTY